jgi:hypothetical protein
MTRRRSSAPGRDRSVRHRSLLFLLPVVIAVFVAACGGSDASVSPNGNAATPTVPPPTSAGSPSSGGASGGPSEAPTDTPPTSDEPTDTPEPSATETPSDQPTEAPTATPSGPAGPAADCAGNADNIDFYASVAQAMVWTVYCPVLPSGWFVDTGSYRLAGGGHMEIAYKGSGGRHIDLSEGSFCTDADGCVPSGTASGDAAFGDQTGTLIATSDGGWAIVVDQGQHPSWLLTGTGMDEAAFRKIAADLMVVAG